jgi:hypothetical protein
LWRKFKFLSNRQEKQVLHKHTNIHFLLHLVQLFLQGEMFQNTHFMFNNVLSKIALFMR